MRKFARIELSNKTPPGRVSGLVGVKIGLDSDRLSHQLKIGLNSDEIALNAWNNASTTREDSQAGKHGLLLRHELLRAVAQLTHQC
jgi:hypothetical protein